MNNKRLGVRPGIPDYLVIVPAVKCITGFNQLIFIEMKKAKGGVVSMEQKIWVQALDSCDGVKAYVCHGADQAINILKGFIK